MEGHRHPRVQSEAYEWGFIVSPRDLLDGVDVHLTSTKVGD
jgi:hypothetical protein